MPHEHKWILNAPYSDKTLMRNHLAYEKTREIDKDKYYAVRSKYVEVLFEDKNIYQAYAVKKAFAISEILNPQSIFNINAICEFSEIDG